MILHILCVLVQLAIQRREFQVRKIFQIPYVVVFGMFLNFFYYDMLTFELHSYGMKLLFVILAYIGLGLFLGPLLLLNLVTIPSEAMCIVISLSLIHISEPTRQAEISYAVFCLKKKN